jgi:NAD(P)-dependent dehydrogenase (short-subunit alcohol dehydrogenase family)
MRWLVSVAQSSSSKSVFTSKPGFRCKGQHYLHTGGTNWIESAKRLALWSMLSLQLDPTLKGQAAKEIIEHVVKQQQGAPPPSLANGHRWTIWRAKRQRTSDLPKIDVLMNNAGVMAVSNRELTVDGYERQIRRTTWDILCSPKLLMPKLTPKRASST